MSERCRSEICKINQESLVSQDISDICHRLEDLRPKIEDKSILISGGAGFLGSWFCQVGLKLGARVICIDNLVSSTEENIQEIRKNPNFTFIKDDVANAAIPDGAQYVVHMASIASPAVYQAMPLETLNSGVFGSVKLLEYSKQNNVLSYLLTSTSEVYGDPPDDSVPTKETYPGLVYSFGPRSMYDESKRVAEAYCYAYQKEVPIRIARIFNTYGPRIDANLPLKNGRTLIKFIHQALKGEPITVSGNGTVTRSFCYVADQIVGLYRLLLTSGIDGEVVNIGNDQEITISELAEKVKLVTGSKSQITLNSHPDYNLENDPKRRKPDLSKAAHLISFYPNITLEEGLGKTIEWVKAGNH